MIRCRYIAIKPLCVVLAFGFLATACGGDKNAGAGDRPGEQADAGVDACPRQPVQGPELVGLWHVNLVFDKATPSPRPFVIDRREAGYSVYREDKPAESVAFEAGALVALWTADAGNGLVRTTVVRFTDIDCHGILSGFMEQCLETICGKATFSGAKVDPLDEPTSERITLVSEYGGPDTDRWIDLGVTYNVRVHGNFAYMARESGLHIVDISDPRAPRQRGVLVPPLQDSGEYYEYYNDVKLIQGPNNTLYAIMASNLRGAVVINVTDPDNPMEVITFPTSDDPREIPSVHTLFIEGTRAYLSYNTTNTVLVFDVSDPERPMELGGFKHPEFQRSLVGFLHDLYVQDGRAYLNYWGLGMTIVDLKDPARPVLVGEYKNYGSKSSHSNWVTRVGDRTISIHGDEEYGAHARIVDVDPDSPTFLTTLSEYQTRPQVSVHNILAHENLAFVTYYQDGLRVLDVRDPANPVKIAHYHTWPAPAITYGFQFTEGAIGVDYNPETKTIYVADTHRGLFILHLDVP